jgi:hypothetical protein
MQCAEQGQSPKSVWEGEDRPITDAITVNVA